MGDPCTTQSIVIPADNPVAYDGLTFYGHMIAGAMAGMGEHLAMFPVDTVKTRMQALSHPGQQLHLSLTKAMNAILRREGVAGLYRGAAAMAIGAGPSHALYFAAYEAAKEVYGGTKPGHHPLATAAAGATATIVNDGCMTPWDVIKQRMQVSHSPFRSIGHCIADTWSQGGLAAFYKSYWTTLVMNVPYTAIHFACYESSKTYFTHSAAKAHGTNTSSHHDDHGDDDDGEDETLLVQLGAGGLAGGLAAAATTPLDVVKTRLQLEGMNSATKYNTISVAPIMRRILHEEGVSALFRGWQPRVLFHVPSAAICWGIYESCKAYLVSSM